MKGGQSTVATLILSIALAVILGGCSERAPSTAPDSGINDYRPRRDWSCVTYFGVSNCTWYAPEADTAGLGNDPACGSYFCGTGDECFRNPRGCADEVGGIILPLLDPVEISTWTGVTEDDGSCPGGLVSLLCIRPLPPVDRALLDSFRHFMRPWYLTSADSVLCEQLAAKVSAMLPYVRMGVNLPGLSDGHGANTSFGITHIDKSELDLARVSQDYKKYVINELFHEAIHQLPSQPTHPSSERGTYSTYPYSRLNFNPTNACIAGGWNSTPPGG